MMTLVRGDLRPVLHGAHHQVSQRGGDTGRRHDHSAERSLDQDDAVRICAVEGREHSAHVRRERHAQGRGLHSSTSQLNLSRFCVPKPQQVSTPRLNLRRFCLRNLST
jgi:hypothetical protein